MCVCSKAREFLREQILLWEKMSNFFHCCPYFVLPQVKITSTNEEMLRAAIEQFIDKTDKEIEEVAMVTLEGHQRAIMGAMTVDEIYKDRKKFSTQVFDIASTDLFNMGIQVRKSKKTFYSSITLDSQYFAAWAIA